MKVIIQNPNLSISILTPSPWILEHYTIRQVAEKDVPEGLPFWVVDDSELPDDHTFQDAWEVPEEWGPPDGYGSQYSTFEEIEHAQDKQ